MQRAVQPTSPSTSAASSASPTDRDVKVLRPAWCRDHFFGLGLGLGLTVIGLGSRPRSHEVLVSGLKRVGLVVSKRSFAFLIN